MIPKSNSCHIYLKICITIQFEGTDYEYNRPEACNFIEKDTLAQVFSCEFYETSKNTFLTEHVWMTASGFSNSNPNLKKCSSSIQHLCDCYESLPTFTWYEFEVKSKNLSRDFV